MALQIGKVYMWKGKPVIVTSGVYDTDNGVNNYWTWRTIEKSGALGEQSSGYDNNGEFSPYHGYVEITVKLED